MTNAEYINGMLRFQGVACLILTTVTGLMILFGRAEPTNTVSLNLAAGWICLKLGTERAK